MRQKQTQANAKTTQEVDQVYLDSVPPRMSSRTKRSHDSSEMSHRALSHTGPEAPEATAKPWAQALGKSPGRQKKERGSNQASSYDGSEDSRAALPLSRMTVGVASPRTLNPKLGNDLRTSESMSRRESTAKVLNEEPTVTADVSADITMRSSELPLPMREVGKEGKVRNHQQDDASEQTTDGYENSVNTTPENFYRGSARVRRTRGSGDSGLATEGKAP